MAANRLVHIESTTSQTAPATIGTITGLSDTVTVASTSSILIINCTISINNDSSDDGALFRLRINGSFVGPAGQAWTDAATAGESGGMSLHFAVTGYSGSTTFDVQWVQSVGTNAPIGTLTYMLEVIEIEDNASIIVNESVTNGGSPGATNAALMQATGVSVSGTGSILLFLASVPQQYQTADGTNAYQFGVDGTPEGPVTWASFDLADGGFSASNIYCKNGVSAGSHSFELNWKYVGGTGADQHASYAGTFQVIEITGEATLHSSILSTTTWDITTTEANDPALDTDQTISAADSIVLVGTAAGQAPSGTDHGVITKLGIDDSAVGGNLKLYNDSSAMYNGGSMLSAQSLSAASHSFQLRAFEDPSGFGAINATANRHLFVLELTQGGVTPPRRIFNI